MNPVLAKRKSRDFLVFILFLQFIVYAIVFFDVPVARQVVGFIYFTFVPGFIFIKLLKLSELDGLETVLFSVGFSVAFLILAGLLINEFCFLFGISQPLSPMPLMVILNSLIFLGGILVYLTKHDVKFLRAETFELSSLALALPLISIPILSVVGVMWVNTYENNWVLLLLIIAIALLFVLGVTSKKILPPKLYSFAVLMIAISLLYHSSLISNYLVPFGSDNPTEYSIFKFTEDNAHWSSFFMYSTNLDFGRINSMLSVTILPTIYSSLLNMDGTWVFKILYPLIFSFVPLALYQLWQKNLGEKRAFIATFLFMAQNTFYTEMLGLNREMVAELFFVLLLLVILSKETSFNKIICFMIFSVALVTSHYAMAEIFLLFISFTCISLIAMKRRGRNLTVTMVMLFFVVMFSWYLYTSNSSAFNSLVSYVDHVYDQLDQFINPESRGQMVLRGLGLEAPPTIWNTFSRIFAYITEFLITVGFVGLITKRIKIRIKKEYFIFTLIAMAFLVALITLPGLADTMNITRFYHILLFFLAPLCVLGAEFLIKLVPKRGTELGVSILLLIVLVPYFFFQTGFVYEITGTQSWSLPLSKHRMDAAILRLQIGWFDEYDAFGALWVSKNVATQSFTTYADRSSSYVLLAYGRIYIGMEFLSNVTVLSTNAYIYLNEANVIDGIILGSNLWNTTSISYIFDSVSKVYSNGGCEVYKDS